MKSLLERIADAVLDAVRQLPPDFAGREEVGMGASGSATSEIDKMLEDLILDTVKTEDAGLSVLSEEAGFIDLKGRRTLVIDPLDGTANFRAKIPFYSVSLAVGDATLGDVTHGLVRNLVSGDTYYAERGKGAWINGSKICTRGFRKEKSLILLYMGMDTAPDTWKIIDLPRRVRSLGCASLEMCQVAAGRADAFYFNCTDFNKMMRVIDIAASTLILREAGGEVYDLRGGTLDMEFSLDDRANFVALGDNGMKEMII